MENAMLFFPKMKKYREMQNPLCGSGGELSIRRALS